MKEIESRSPDECAIFKKSHTLGGPAQSVLRHWASFVCCHLSPVHSLLIGFAFISPSPVCLCVLLSFLHECVIQLPPTYFRSSLVPKIIIAPPIDINIGITSTSIGSMDNKLSLVLSLSTVLLVLYANGALPRLAMAQEENYHVVECVLPHYFLCDNGNCLPESHLCDGEADCGPNDNSDEEPSFCAKMQCNATTEFKCASGRCIPKEARCDREPTCRDKSDELNCVYEPCPAGKFSCANHSQCLDMNDVCDGIIDCKADASDERHDGPASCPTNVTCPSDTFKCANTNVCALPNWMCDGENDCGDGSDEIKSNCKNFKCPEDWFRCGDDRCIPMSSVCNGIVDCRDGLASDERHPDPCPRNVTCPPEFFSCENTNICAHPHWLCDGADDCGDQSDENLDRCANTPCPEDWFRCKSQRCIPPNWRCDGGADCPTAEDEDKCEEYFQEMYLAENNTLVSTGNSSQLEDANERDNTRRLTPLDLGNKANKQTASVNKQKVNPISSYLNSQPNSASKSNKTTSL